MHRAGIAAACCVWAAIAPLPSAAAQPLAGVELTWDAPARCPPTMEVLTEARRLLGPDFRHTARLDVEIELEDVGDAFILRLAVEGEASEGERELRMASCQEVRDAAALLIALSLDPELSTQAPEPEPEPEPEPADAPGLPPVLELELPVMGADSSLLPSLAPTLGLGIALRLAPLRFSLGADYFVPNAVDVRVGPIDAPSTRFAVEVDALAARAGVCWELFGNVRWSLGPCAGLWLLRMAAEPRIAGAEPRAHVLVAPELAVAGAYDLSRLVSLRLRLGALVPVLPPRFEVVGGAAVHAVPAVSAQAAISLVFRHHLGG